MLLFGPIDDAIIFGWSFLPIFCIKLPSWFIRLFLDKFILEFKFRIGILYINVSVLYLIFRNCNCILLEIKIEFKLYFFFGFMSSSVWFKLAQCSQSSSFWLRSLSGLLGLSWVSLRSISGLSRVSLRSLLSLWPYLVGQTKPKTLGLVLKDCVLIDDQECRMKYEMACVQRNSRFTSVWQRHKNSIWCLP